MTAGVTATKHGGPGPEEVRDAQTTATRVAAAREEFGPLGLYPGD